MAATSYSPGTWFGIVRSRTAVLLGPATDPALVAALWDLLEGRPEVHEVLHAVTSSSGGSLANIPSFGILDFAGSLRVFLRGDLDVTVESPEGPVELNGRDVTTWNERRLALPGLCRLTIPAAAGIASNHGLPELPVGEGVVLLQSLVLAPEGSILTQQEPHAQQEALPQHEVQPAPEAAVQAEAVNLPEITVAPEHGASAETVYAVIDEDFEVDPGVDVDEDSLQKLEPLADIDPEGAGQSVTSAQPDVIGAAAGASNAAAAGVTGSSDRSEQVPASEMTSSYDHLWERTVVRRIEDAAVREDPEAASPDAGSQEAPDQEATHQEAVDQREAVAAPATPGSPGHSPAAAAAAAAPADGDVLAADVPPAVVLGVPPTGAPGPAPVRPATGSLIDSVPWRTADAGKEPGPPPAVLSPMLSAVPSAPSDAPLTPAPETGHAEYDGDHDGQTVMKSNLGKTAIHPAPAKNDVSAAGPLVLARLCPQDHANPPTSATCATCGAGLLPDAVQVARPRLGRMRISTGELVDLDESLILGRQPSVSRVQGGVMPRLVQVASPGGDISRSHVEVRLEGWHVMLCDLKATNGTVLVREGQAPRRLAQNEMAILLDGDIAELGDNISLRFEEIP
ncbi:FHA domain-containing protein [Arthrobacter sp. ZGTC412]|uniref:FHA domain-containing protein n=1 Tax=Arthrobacter sp. ZGTC412 TaxID=2058900 RepID=UPI000CE4950F|nr:FHA domain-containing protein [Arthrobacter sp. ZGTC412]